MHFLKEIPVHEMLKLRKEEERKEGESNREWERERDPERFEIPLVSELHSLCRAQAIRAGQL